MAVHLCRVYMQGKTSMVMTVHPEIKRALGLVPHDVLGFRIREIQGKLMLIGEKVALHKIAALDQVPVDVLK